MDVAILPVVGLVTYTHVKFDEIFKSQYLVVDYFISEMSVSRIRYLQKCHTTVMECIL